MGKSAHLEPIWSNLIILSNERYYIVDIAYRVLGRKPKRCSKMAIQTKFGCTCLDWEYIARVRNMSYVKCNKCGVFHRSSSRGIKTVSKDEMVDHIKTFQAERIAKNDFAYADLMQKGLDKVATL